MGEKAFENPFSRIFLLPPKVYDSCIEKGMHKYVPFLINIFQRFLSVILNWISLLLILDQNTILVKD